MRVLLDDPVKFFRKKEEGLLRTIFYFMAFLLFFIIMNEAMVRYGFVKYQPVAGVFESIAINYAAVLSGFVLLSFITFVLSSMAGTKASLKQSIFVIAHSSTPLLLLGWVPFSVVKVIALIWSVLFLTLGIKIKMKFDYRKSVTIAALVLVILFVVIVLSQNYIITPIPLA